jgi:hypothetical protein
MRKLKHVYSNATKSLKHTGAVDVVDGEMRGADEAKLHVRIFKHWRNKGYQKIKVE